MYRKALEVAMADKAVGQWDGWARDWYETQVKECDKTSGGKYLAYMLDKLSVELNMRADEDNTVLDMIISMCKQIRSNGYKQQNNNAVIGMKKAIRREFVNVKHLSEQIALIDKAIDLANEDVDDLEAIRELGQGWVAEETLAIAIYCTLKYSNDFDKALIASVNHSGDSDSTGAVTGNILGTYLGLSGIPEKYLKNLELKNVILELADDLFNDCKITEYGSYHDEIWEQKYIYKSYRPKR